jgi:dienelactone hydrolase
MWGSRMKVIILIHEVYGVTENLLGLKGLLEKEGYRVLCPSLYIDGYVGDDEEKSYKKFYNEVGLDRGKAIIDTVMADNGDNEYLLIGFSVGATIAWLESRAQKVSKVICVYGSRIRDFLGLEPRAKAYLLFCEEKTFDVEDIGKRLSDRESVIFRKIEGYHGFYSKAKFTDRLIQGLNREILGILAL